MRDLPLDVVPLWVLFVLTCAIIGLSIEFGRRLGRRFQRAEGQPDPSVSAVVGAILGLLAFLLAFTFGMAASRYEERRQTVLDEANAIGTTYLRAEFLPEPERHECQMLLRRYVDVRVAVVRSRTHLGAVMKAVATSEDLLDRLWGHAVDAMAKTPVVSTSLFVQSLNEVIDNHTIRVQVGVRSRIPLPIWAGLISVALVGLGSAGFQAGFVATRRPILLLGLLLVFAFVLTLIADLDRPAGGMLRTSQAPMFALQERLQREGPPSAVTPRPASPTPPDTSPPSPPGSTGSPARVRPRP